MRRLMTAMTARALAALVVCPGVAAGAAGCAHSPAGTATGPTTKSTTKSTAKPATTPDKMAVTAPAPPPTLGLSWGPSSKGYGAVRPSTVFNGGDPSGLVSGITWSSWGGATATGTGTGLYAGPNQIVATGTHEKATIVAFNLGTCDGHRAYTALKWYFPGEKETFSNPSFYINACTHAYLSP